MCDVCVVCVVCVCDVWCECGMCAWRVVCVGVMCVVCGVCVMSVWCPCVCGVSVVCVYVCGVCVMSMWCVSDVWCECGMCAWHVACVV